MLFSQIRAEPDLRALFICHSLAKGRQPNKNCRPQQALALQLTWNASLI
jgi:hypothetical protein